MEPIATFDERHGIDTHVTEGSPGQGKDATYDEPRAWGAPKGPHTISFKQEGLSDTDALHPYMNATGKSQKGEGDIETAKVKGAVSPNRPQV
ncbi:hypothetical protein N7466_009499 [Penicillium verhagenii]|uniref:uncharacterized protein n=1 Tax=Penicillium verhagenii TaxID=1562060 RepID=UPI0025456871|nr:uncharacterized protein N7466_009499 [Penicillium verhagenii]KAJ5921173.1 hypothetical protein N7466_009499 [Penicillium verhagenii]